MNCGTQPFYEVMMDPSTFNFSLRVIPQHFHLASFNKYGFQNLSSSFQIRILQDAYKVWLKKKQKLGFYNHCLPKYIMSSLNLSCVWCKLFYEIEVTDSKSHKLKYAEYQLNH